MPVPRIPLSSRLPVVCLILSFALLANCASSGLTQALCSSQNTGADHGLGSYTYQSNGWCYDHCNTYAFGIVQSDKCWCSNYAPAKTADVGTFCNKTCPGYPTDLCGDKDAGYFGYIPINGVRPSGTMNPSSAATKPSSSTAKQIAPAPAPTGIDVTSSRSETSSSPISTGARDDDDRKPSTSAGLTGATPITSVQVITVSGAIVTQTVTTMPTAAKNNPPKDNGGGSVSTGAIAGATVGSVAGFALITGAVLFFLRRRRNNDGDVDYAADGESASKRSSPKRNVSVLSKMGLLEKTQPVHVPNRNSTHTGDSVGVSPVSERRSSHPMFYDQRLNPNALMVNDNGSRSSVLTMQDNRDYTRTLGVRNPDPRPSFEAN